MAGQQDNPVQEHPLSKAVREQLIELLRDPLNPGRLMKIENIVRPARKMLESLQSDDDILSSLGKKPGVQSANYIDTVESLAPYEGGAVPLGSGTNALSGASNAENFGARAIRELVSSLAGTNDTPEKLLPAIAQARELNLKDVEQSLMDRLSKMLPGTEKMHHAEEGETCGVKSDRYPEGYICPRCLEEQAVRDAEDRAEVGCGRTYGAGYECGDGDHRCHFCMMHRRNVPEAAE